jgi:hypothetical protein
MNLDGDEIYLIPQTEMFISMFRSTGSFRNRLSVQGCGVGTILQAAEERKNDKRKMAAFAFIIGDSFTDARHAVPGMGRDYH